MTLTDIQMSKQIQIDSSKEVVILIAEDNEQSVLLMQLGLKRAGILNKTIHFKNGAELFDFLCRRIEVGDIAGSDTSQQFHLSGRVTVGNPFQGQFSAGI